MNIRLFVFLACLVVVQSYKDLQNFCRDSAMLHAVSETHPTYDARTYTCTVELPFFAQDNRIAEYICSYYAPFPTLRVEPNTETVKCIYHSKRYCPDGEHLIQSVCVKIVKGVNEKGMSFDEYNTKTCTHGYKTLKVLNRDMARWISTLGVIKATKGIWIDRASTSEVNTKLGQNEAKYLNLVLSLGSNKRISSILHTNQQNKLFGVCVAEKHETYVDQVASNAAAKYFLTENLYSPSSINGYLTDGKDNFAAMDAMCKELNPNSMLATAIPQGTSIVGMTPNSLVYVGVRGAMKNLFGKAQQDCSKTKDYKTFFEHFRAVVHSVNGTVTESGVDGSLFKTGYPNYACADVPKTAVAYDGEALIDIVPIARLRIACVTGNVKGLKEINECGNGGVYNPASGECDCIDGWVDITTMGLNDEFKSYQKGELCVPKTPCRMENEKNYIIFLMDGSTETHTNASYIGMKNFVSNAKSFISNQNTIHFIVYGGNGPPPEGLVHSGWNATTFDEMLHKALHGYGMLGRDTNVAQGFEKAWHTLHYYRKAPPYPEKKFIVIHIGDGIPWGNCGFYCTEGAANFHYEMLARPRPFEVISQWAADRVIAVGIARRSENMEEHWHTDGDYVNMVDVKYEDLKMPHMDFLMRKVCNQQSLTEMIHSAYSK